MINEDEEPEENIPETPDPEEDEELFPENEQGEEPLPEYELEPEEPSEEQKIIEQKKRILDKIESQVDLASFWQEVLSVPAWSEILRIYYRLNAGLVQKIFTAFTIKAIRTGEKIEWVYTFFDSNGNEINFDALNESKVAE